MAAGKDAGGDVHVVKDPGVDGAPDGLVRGKVESRENEAGRFDGDEGEERVGGEGSEGVDGEVVIDGSAGAAPIEDSDTGWGNGIEEEVAEFENPGADPGEGFDGGPEANGIEEKAVVGEPGAFEGVVMRVAEPSHLPVAGQNDGG